MGTYNSKSGDIYSEKESGNPFFYRIKDFPFEIKITLKELQGNTNKIFHHMKLPDKNTKEF